MIRSYARAAWHLLHLSGTSNYVLTSNVMPVLRILEPIQSCFCWCNGRMMVLFGRPLGHSWFGYGLILCVLCTLLTWSSSCWIIPMKQNFKHSLENTVRQFKFCYFYFIFFIIIIIIIVIIIFLKSKKDKLYSLHYWID